jgi:uncharacterized protein
MGSSMRTRQKSESETPATSLPFQRPSMDAALTDTMPVGIEMSAGLSRVLKHGRGLWPARALLCRSLYSLYHHFFWAVLLSLLIQTTIAQPLSLPDMPSSMPSNKPNNPSLSMRSAQEVIKQLNLAPHPEKGWYIQTFEDPATKNNRSASTAIYYLLEKGEVSHWHRVLDATEIWHHYLGAPLQLSLSFNDGKPVRHQILGPNIFDNQAPQVIVKKGEWQRAKSMGQWTLVGCTVAPGFTFAGFEMAPQGWEPKVSSPSSGVQRF